MSLSTPPCPSTEPVNLYLLFVIRSRWKQNHLIPVGTVQFRPCQPPPSIVFPRPPSPLAISCTNPITRITARSLPLAMHSGGYLASGHLRSFVFSVVRSHRQYASTACPPLHPASPHMHYFPSFRWCALSLSSVSPPIRRQLSSVCSFALPRRLVWEYLFIVPHSFVAAVGLPFSLVVVSCRPCSCPTLPLPSHILYAVPPLRLLYFSC